MEGYSRREALKDFAVALSGGILISGCGLKDPVEPFESYPAVKILSGGADLRAIMRQRGYFVTDADTRRGYLIEGIYRVSRDGGIWRLVPVLRANVAAGEGLIYKVKGKPFPLVGVDDYSFSTGDTVTWLKKLRNGFMSTQAFEFTI